MKISLNNQVKNLNNYIIITKNKNLNFPNQFVLDISPIKYF